MKKVSCFYHFTFQIPTERVGVHELYNIFNINIYNKFSFSAFSGEINNDNSLKFSEKC